VPVMAKVPDVMAATATAPTLEMVKLLVPVLRALVAVIVPLLLRIVSGSVKVYAVLIAIAPVPVVLPKVIPEKVPGKKASSVSSIASAQTARPQEVEVIALPIPTVVVAVLGLITKAPVPLIAPPMLMASVVRVKLLAFAVTVEPVVMAEADKVVIAPIVRASL